jgi:hypothetical protein
MKDLLSLCKGSVKSLLRTALLRFYEVTIKSDSDFIVTIRLDSDFIEHY